MEKGAVRVCTAGQSCLALLSEINETADTDLIPTLVLIGIPEEERSDGPLRDGHPSSPTTSPFDTSIAPHMTERVFYGMNLLHHIASQIQYQNFSKLVIPIALLHGTRTSKAALDSEGQETNSTPSTSSH